MTLKTEFQFVGITQQTDLIFSTSGTTSSTIDCVGTSPRGLIFPTNWVAGNVTFQVGRSSSIGEGHFEAALLFPLYLPDGTGIFTLATVANSWLPLIPYYFDSVRYLRIVSSVAQTGAPTVKTLMMPLYQGVHS